MPLSKLQRLIRLRGVATEVIGNRLFAQDVNARDCFKFMGWVDVTGWSETRVMGWLGY